jgi:hypothetical protein
MVNQTLEIPINTTELGQILAKNLTLDELANFISEIDAHFDGLDLQLALYEWTSENLAEHGVIFRKDVQKPKKGR